MRLSPGDFLGHVLANGTNAALLDRLPALGLPQCHLTAGCLFQTLWNRRSGRPPDWGIRDYDIFYFDGADLSWNAEDAVIRRAEASFADLPARIEIRNQARVHLWYERKFGARYPPLRSARDGIDRYLVACTCVGIEAATGILHAPNGLDDLWEGRLCMNTANPQPAAFLKKAENYRARWPWLTIIDPGPQGP